MARPDLPDELPKLKEVVTKIDAQNTLLGDDSSIKQLIIQHEIVLGTDISNLDDAIKIDYEASTFRSQSENLIGKRNIKADPIMKHIAAMGQTVKTFYAPDFGEVRTWDFDITNSGKFTYTTDADGRVALMNKIKLKHNAFAAGTSPLQPYISKNNLVLADMVTALEDAKGFESDATTASENAENRIGQRNLLVDPVLANVHLIANWLMDLNKDNPKALGDWGIPVADTKQKAKEVQSIIKLSDKAILDSVIIGGTLRNIGPGEAHIYKGKVVAGEPIILAPGEIFGVPKGFSTLTVVNPSNLHSLTVKAVRAK